MLLIMFLQQDLIQGLWGMYLNNIGNKYILLLSASRLISCTLINFNISKKINSYPFRHTYSVFDCKLQY